MAETESDKINQCSLRCTHFAPRRLLFISSMFTTLPSLSHFTPYHVRRGLADSQLSRFFHLSPPQSLTMSRRACRSMFTAGGWVACACVFAGYSPGQSSPMLHVPCCMCTHSPLFFCRPCLCCFSYRCVEKILFKRNFCVRTKNVLEACSGVLTGSSSLHSCYDCCMSQGLLYTL
jgi:hypothetical protein